MKHLRECTTLKEAQPFLRNASATQRKVVETAFALKAHPNAAQQAIGESFWLTALQEMDKTEEPTPHHDKGIKSKGEHFVKEETLAGGDKSGTEGSEQSSKNKLPLSKEGTEEPDGDMETPGMSTENQFNEIGNNSPVNFAQPPGQMPPQMPPQMPGLDPQLAQQMAPQGNMPPMTTPQQIQQMQYTVKEYLRPLIAHMKKQETQIVYQNKAIKSLTQTIQETSALKGGLDLNGFKERSVVHNVQETMPSTVTNLDPQAPKIFEKTHQLETKRTRIAELNRMLENSPSHIQ